MSYNRAQLLGAVETVLQQNPRISLKAVSGILIERHTIEKAVKECTGMTFRELQCRLILHEAHRLLNQTDERGSPFSIKQVAFTVGFRSPRSFSRLIKRLVVDHLLSSVP